MRDPYLELLDLVRWERKSLTPETRAREFLESIQRIKNGDEVEVVGFILLRKPPFAPSDAAYYLLTPLSPSELSELFQKSEIVLRPYLVLRIDGETRIKGKVLSGSYVRVKGILDAYPVGNLRMVRVTSLRSEDYSRYWASYEEMALRPKEVEELIGEVFYATRSFQLGITYALFGSPPLIGSPRGWSEGYEFSVFGYKGRETELKVFWNIMKFFYSLLPPELRLRKRGRGRFLDDFLGLDFTFFDPNNTSLRYYVPRSFGRLPKFALKTLLDKRAIGLLPLPEQANPLDELSRKAETPFVFIPMDDERPYLENGEMLKRHLPNLLVTVFLEREKLSAIPASGKVAENFQRGFEEWILKNRDEYGWEFDLLTVPGSVFDVGLRYELSFRLLGAIGRFRGRIGRSEIRRVYEMNDEVLNDWMVVVKSLPQSRIEELIKNYRGYLPPDKRAAKALRIFRDLASTSLTEEVLRVEFKEALVRAGFSPESAEKVVELLIKEGYVYEPFAGRLRLVK